MEKEILLSSLTPEARKEILEHLTNAELHEISQTHCDRRTQLIRISENDRLAQEVNIRITSIRF